MRLLRRLVTEDGLAVVCVLYQSELAARADRLVGLRSSLLEFDRPASDVSSQQIAGLYLAEAS